MAKRLAKLTRNVTGLIDDTVITAATYRANDGPQPLDLNAIVDAIIQEEDIGIGSSYIHLRVTALPGLIARRSHMNMLFEEMLLSAIRSGRLGQVPDVEIGSHADADGNPIIWFKEKRLHLSARKQIMARRFSDL